MNRDIFLTPSAAARMLERSEGSVRKYEQLGKLPAVRTSTGMRLFRRSDVELFAKKLREARQPE